MFVSDHWKHFEPVGQIWHFINAILYALIGILALLANLMVLFYLIK